MPFDDRNSGPEPRRPRKSKRALLVLAFSPVIVLIIYYAVEYLKGR